MLSHHFSRSKLQSNGCKLLLHRAVSSLTWSNTPPLLLHKNKEDTKFSPIQTPLSQQQQQQHYHRYFSSKPFHLPNFNSIEEEIDDANQRYANLITIQPTSDRGYGLVASKTYQTGDKVLTAKAVASVPRDSHSVQVGWDDHVRINLPARFINHSCDANTGAVKNEFGAYDFVALRTIEEGEELAFNYETTEYIISAFETCMCGSWNCRKELGGFKKHGEELKEQYGTYIADYLK